MGAAVLDIEVMGNYAYILCNDIFYIIDISNKNNPFAVGYTTVGGVDFNILGNYAFVIGQHNGLRVIDIADPSQPEEEYFYSLRFNNISPDLYQIKTDPDMELAYIAADEQGVMIVDISDPLNPSLISMFDTPVSAQSVAFRNSLIYITDYNALRIFDISSPVLPVEIKSYIVPPDEQILNFHKVVVDQDYIYVGTSHGLVIIGYENQEKIEYKNTQYGFSFSLPASWQGYSIITATWEGNPAGSDAVIEQGPVISIRNPKWTSEKPYQDIPVMVFTVAQWNLLLQEEFHIGAAPVGPSELGRNSAYVFALPARYNFAYPEGVEEVEKILAGDTFKAF